MMENIFSEIPENSLRDNVLQYAKTTYGTTPERLWRSHPDFLVLRHEDNQKWYGLVMDVEREKLHLPDDLRKEDDVDILNLKCDPNLAGSLMANPGIFPAYHMNKVNWISVLLDGSVPEKQIFSLLDLSFDLTAGKKTGGRSRTGSCTWVIPANPRYYDLEEAFGESDTITWKQGRGIRAGDTVLIYMAAPVSSILYMCHVLETDIPYSFDDGKIKDSLIDLIQQSSCISNDQPQMQMRILLPEPFPSSPSKHTNILGLKYSSVILEETIPATP